MVPSSWSAIGPHFKMYIIDLPQVTHVSRKQWDFNKLDICTNSRLIFFPKYYHF